MVRIEPVEPVCRTYHLAHSITFSSATPISCPLLQPWDGSWLTGGLMCLVLSYRRTFAQPLLSVWHTFPPLLPLADRMLPLVQVLPRKLPSS